MISAISPPCVMKITCDTAKPFVDVIEVVATGERNSDRLDDRQGASGRMWEHLDVNKTNMVEPVGLCASWIRRCCTGDHETEPAAEAKRYCRRNLQMFFAISNLGQSMKQPKSTREHSPWMW